MADAGSGYPEHDKLQAVSKESQAIGEFLDFGGYTLCTHRAAGNNGEPEFLWNGREREGEPDWQDYIANRAVANPAYESWGSGFEPVHKPITQILADYFEIDLDKIEEEKRAMLDEIRKANP